MFAKDTKIVLEAIDDAGQPARPRRTARAVIAEVYEDGCFRTTAPDGSCAKDWMPDGYRYTRIGGVDRPTGGWRAVQKGRK